MFISDFSIKKPIVTITAMLALVVFGLIALGSLETDEFPDIQAPIIAVTVPYPGASPEVVEREVVEPLEEAFFGISGIQGKDTLSAATDGLAQFVVVFEFSKDVQQASQDIRDAISSKRADLPLEIEDPVINRFDPADEPIVSLTLTSPSVPVDKLTRFADEVVTRELRAIPGVAQARVVGGLERELAVELHPAALQASGLTVDDVVQALQAQNLAAPVGNLQTELTERSIRLRGRLDSPDEFANLVVSQRGGVPIRLRQVAAVKDGHEEPRTLALFNGEEAVGVEILKAKGYSTTEVSDEVRRRVEGLQERLPAGTELAVVQDAGERVRRSVDDVKAALLEGAMLTVLVVFLFLNSWRSTVITGLALPVSVLASFIGVWAFGFTLNTMSLLGLSLAIGILIDDAIVVRENIVRHIEMGEGHYSASRKGTSEIGLAVTATTFSIVAVFVPVAFMYGIAGQWFKPFAITIAAAVLVSLLVAFSLDPMLSAYWPDPQVERGARRGRLSHALSRFNRWFDGVADRYKGVIAWALDHRAAMVGFVTLAMIGSIALQVFFGGAGFVPVSDRSEVSLLVETAPGSSLGYTRRKVEEATRVVRAHPEVAYAYASIGTPLPLRSPGVDQALVYIRLVPRAARELSQEELGAGLRTELARIAGADISVFTSGFGGAFKSIQIQLRGPDARRLAALAEEVRGIVRSVPGAVDVGLSTRGQKPEVEVRLDRGLARSERGAGGAVAAAGLRGHRRRRLGRPERRDAGRDGALRTRGAHERAGPAAGAPVRRYGRDGRAGALAPRPGGPHQRGHRPGTGESPRSRPCHRRAGERPRPLVERGGGRYRGAVGAGAPAAGLPHHPGRGGRRSGRGLLPRLARSLGGGDADVPHPRHPVRVLLGSLGHHRLAAPLAHRRRAGPAGDGRHPQHHEPHRGHPADGHRRQERHLAHRFCQVGSRARREPARGAHRGGPHPPAADRHDLGGDHRRHGARRHRCGGGRRFSGTSRPRGDRRRHHVDAAHAARHPDGLRDPRRLAFGSAAGSRASDRLRPHRAGRHGRRDERGRSAVGRRARTARRAPERRLAAGRAKRCARARSADRRGRGGVSGRRLRQPPIPRASPSLLRSVGGRYVSPMHRGYQRIVCLPEETTETLYLLGEQDWIVGISGFTVRPRRACEEKPKVSVFTSAKNDEIRRLAPDLVLGFSDLQADIARDLVRAGLEVHIFNHRDVAGILAMVRTLGALVGAVDKAEHLAGELAGRVEACQPGPAALTDGLDALRTIVESWASANDAPPPARSG